MPSPNRIAPGLSNMKETVRASSTVASDNRRYAQQAKGQSCITPVGYQAAGVPWSSRSDHASNWGTACWPFQRTVSFYTAFHVFSVYDSRVQAHEFSTCRGATFMHEMAVSLPERLPNEIAGVLTPGIRIISTGVDIRRMATLQGMLNTLQGRLKERTAQLEAQVAEGQKVEERLRELTTRVLHAQDDESRRIARELHDSAGQYLAAIQMNLNALERDTSSPLSSSQIKRVTDSVEMVDHCSAEIRTLSYLLHPPLLDEMGLASALSMYSDGFAERSGIRVELDISKDFGRLSTDIETAMFRIVQQSLANIYRHSGSLVAKITIRQDAEDATMNISDEGHGMAPAVLKECDSGTHLVGVGVAGMRERTRALKGRFHISSGRSGTIIDISIPIAEDIRPQ